MAKKNAAVKAVREFYTLNEAARELKISRAKIDARVKSGDLVPLGLNSEIDPNTKRRGPPSQVVSCSDVLALQAILKADAKIQPSKVIAKVIPMSKRITSAKPKATYSRTSKKVAKKVGKRGKTAA